MKIFRHGDILLKEVSPQNLVKKESVSSYVLAEGETTGHRHLLTAERESLIDIFRDDKGNQFLNIKGAKLTHEEHKTLEIGTGFYQVIHEREFDPFLESINRVRD